MDEVIERRDAEAAVRAGIRWAFCGTTPRDTKSREWSEVYRNVRAEAYEQARDWIARQKEERVT
jgi:hypothetical protein